jgi:transcriptional regulator with XRE-family HTH domain
MSTASLASRLGWMFHNERVRRRMSQAHVAEVLHVTQQWVSQVERGVRAPTADAVERLFAILDLKVTVGVEPTGPNLETLDDEIDDVLSLSDDDRLAVVDSFHLAFDELATVPWVLSGRLGAFIQGAPLRVVRLDLAVAEPDLDLLAAVFDSRTCDRWNERLMEYYGAAVHPRLPGPMRWLLGPNELYLEVTNRLPPSITVAVAGRYLPVRPLADIEARYPSVAQIMRRTRTRTRVVHR